MGTAAAMGRGNAHRVAQREARSTVSKVRSPLQTIQLANPDNNTQSEKKSVKERGHQKMARERGCNGGTPTGCRRVDSVRCHTDC